MGKTLALQSRCWNRYLNLNQQVGGVCLHSSAEARFWLNPVVAAEAVETNQNMSNIPLRDRGVRRTEDPVVAPLRHTRNGYSQESIGRFSEHTIHSAYRLEGESHEGKFRVYILISKSSLKYSSMVFSFGTNCGLKLVYLCRVCNCIPISDVASLLSAR